MRLMKSTAQAVVQSPARADSGGWGGGYRGGREEEFAVLNRCTTQQHSEPLPTRPCLPDLALPRPRPACQLNGWSPLTFHSVWNAGNAHMYVLR